MVKVNDLTRCYRVGDATVNALNGVSLELGNGEALAVVGRSGSGKSVILKHILGFLRPDKGDIIYKGKNTNTMVGFIKCCILTAIFFV